MEKRIKGFVKIAIAGKCNRGDNQRFFFFFQLQERFAICPMGNKRLL
jgi:hypothetical protein